MKRRPPPARPTFPPAAHAILCALPAALLPLLFFASAAHAVDFGDLSVTGSSQTEYSRATDDTDEADLEILEEWFDLDVYYDDLSGGIRYEAFQPPQVNDPLGEEVREGIPFRYVEVNQKWGKVRVGNFYALFGRGLVLNLFEDRFVRIDNNLDGIKVETGYGSVNAVFLSGRTRAVTGQRWALTTPSVDRRDLIHAGDITVDVADPLRLGVTYAGNHTAAGGTERIQDMWSGRAELTTGPLSLYGERGNLEGIDGPDGKGTYLGSSLAMHKIGLNAEYKDYDHFDFSSTDGVYLNNPPALSREHSYTLLTRNPHQLNVKDEKGYQVELTFSPSLWTNIVLNTSRTRTHEDDTTFEEYSLEGRHEATEGLLSSYAGVVNYQADLDSYNFILVGDVTIALDEANSLRTEFSHMHTRSNAVGEFDTELLVLEYSRSPSLVLGANVEWNNRSEAQLVVDKGAKKHTAFGTATVNLSEDTDLTLLYGSRQSGYYCLGGRCRFEPAFEGLEAKLITRF